MTQSAQSNAQYLNQLILKIATQDEASFLELFDLCASRLKAYALKCGAEPASAEDLVQDCMLTVWNKAPQFNPKAATAMTWMYTIIRNRRIDLLRKEKPNLIQSYDLWPDSNLEESQTETLHSDELEEDVESDLNSKLVRILIESLPEEQRQIVYKVYFEGKSHSEISLDLGLPLGTIKSRLRLAMKKLDNLAKRTNDMANYHPADELLMQFAAGQLTNALGIQTACHLESCKVCQRKVQVYEQLGGDLIDISTPVAMAEDAKETLLNKLHQHQQQPLASTHIREQDIALLAQADERIPRPLRRFVSNYYEQLPWSGLTKSIQSYDLPFSDEQYTARFYKIAAGKELPQHTHKGNEYTLVLSGSFSDLSGDYHPGDFVLADSSTHHQPKAHNKEDCICFAVMDAPLKMTGFFTRLLNPFIK